MKGCLTKSGKAIIACVIGAAMTVMLAIPAFGHVSISPSEAAQGGYGTFTLKVPNESATASTTKLELKIPTNTPIASVSVEPKVGWTYKVEKSKLSTPLKDDDGNETSEVVSKITFEGGSIKPGEFDEFKLSMGPLPTDADSLTFKAIQTYDDGEVVSWIEETPASGEEPEHPAPTVMLTKASVDDHHSSTTTSDTDTSKDAASDNDSNNTVGYVGIGLGAIALFVGLGALLKKK